MTPVRFAIVMILVLMALVIRCSNGTPAAILRSLEQARQEERGSKFITEAISDEQSSSIVEEYLKDGIGIFQFGMSIEKLQEILPNPQVTTSYPQDNTFYRGSEKYYSIWRELTDFAQLNYVWRYINAFDKYISAFNKEWPILGNSACLSAFSGVRFLFRDEGLTRINFWAADFTDCASHEPAFDAIASFFHVKIVKFSALGMELNHVGQHIGVTLGTLDNGPASRAGVKLFDELIAINGHSINGSTNSEIATKLRGPPGSEIVLTLKRANDDKPRDFSVTRGPVADAERFHAKSKLVCFSGSYAHHPWSSATISIGRPTAGLGCEDLALVGESEFY